jgi:hypothetical protein
MKKISPFFFSLIIALIQFNAFGQNVGISIAVPAGKLHVKGSEDNSQFILDAHSTQSNTNPLIRLRKSDGTDLMWIHADDSTNLFLGLKAGRVNNLAGGGINNVFIGKSAGFANTTGHNNTAGGVGALFSNTTGYYNTAIGKSALSSNTKGYENTAQGWQALASNTTASQNIAIGNSALFTQSYNNNNTPWNSSNVAIGYGSLYSNQPTSIATGKWNTALGTHAMYSNTIGNENTAGGYYALQNNTTGNYNTANGSLSLFYNTKGNDNTANGVQALSNNTTASQNIAIGNNALLFQSYSNNNTSWVSGNVAVGYNSLQYNQPTSPSNGYINTAVGSNALTFNTTGWANTAIGSGALYSNITGEGNTASGTNSLRFNSVGHNNVASGSSAMQYNTAAGQNTAIGVYALYNQSYNPGSPWTSGNVAVGYEALYFNEPTSVSNGVSNTAVGTAAMRANTTGWDNTGIGGAALYSNTTGIQNTAIGRQALFYNISGLDNVAVGFKALRQNSTGSSNVASGDYSLYSNADGYQNCAAGYNALYSNTSGYGNTASGMNSLYYLVGGANNTAIGFGSGAAPGSPNVINTVSVGNNGYLNGASNQAFLGNLSTGWNGGNQTWSTFSDARIKNNVSEDVIGLEFILKLRPVTYYRSIHAAVAITGNKETEEYPEKYDVEKVKESGFLAQEVEQAANASAYDFNGLTVPRSSNELYTLSYERFVVPLVKAMQEQQKMIEALKAVNQELISRIEVLEGKE